MLLVAVALTGAVALPAQPPNVTFMGASVGVAARPTYFRSQPLGIDGAFTFGRALSRHVALRLDVDAQRFGVRDTTAVSDCNSPGFGRCGPAPDGPVATFAVLAGAEWYVRPDHRSIYLVGGLGPQWLTANPDGPRAAHFVVQAGVGLALALGPNALLIEVWYQRVAGATGDAIQAVPITVTFRGP